MGAKCIMRTRKLKANGNVGASLAHAFRDRETPNADPKRTKENFHAISKSREQAMKLYHDLLPDKVRKNGVRCIEYLVTYSPKGLPTADERNKYFNDAIAWLKAKHGKNLFHIGVHYDETTPHLYAYAVPIDEKGNLNCRAFLGGAAKMSDMQDDFFEKVGKPSGLERGIKWSKAQHRSVRAYYAMLESELEPFGLQIPKVPGFFYDHNAWRDDVQKAVEKAAGAILKQSGAERTGRQLAEKRAGSAELSAAVLNKQNEQLRAEVKALTDQVLNMSWDELQQLRKKKEALAKAKEAEREVKTPEPPKVAKNSVSKSKKTPESDLGLGR